MKYLKPYKMLFESMSVDQINELIQHINDILQDLKDDNWNIKISFFPKRWLSGVESDQIRIDIRKNKCKSGSKYPLDSEFKLSDISDYTLRIIEYVKPDIKEDSILVSICKHDPSKSKYYGETDFKVGQWNDLSPLKDNQIDNEEYIFGIVLQLALNGENLDEFKHGNILGDFIH